MLMLLQKFRMIWWDHHMRGGAGQAPGPPRLMPDLHGRAWLVFGAVESQE